ncbi:MAG TPA: Mov34/MPN/PAD-1 family protein [Pirellulales bacterium]|nr:Mov34/MPN/PAD-1 family protein [Pirellulales bacterium]
MFCDDFPFQPEQPAERRSNDREIGDLKPAQRKLRCTSSTPRETTQPIDDEHVDHDEPLPLMMMKITQPALRDMMDYLLAREPESAGLLLGPTNDDLLITHFVPDRTGRGTISSFELGAPELNRVLKLMKPAGITGKGIGHSHPAGITSPSHGDLIYLRRVFGLPSNAGAAQFYMPIVCGGRLYPYVYAQGRVWRADLVLV